MCELRESGSAMRSTSQDVTRQRESLLRFETVKRWMSCETINSSSTRRAYLRYLQILVDHFGCDPDQGKAIFALSKRIAALRLENKD
jgi:hypothetical protein